MDLKVEVWPFLFDPVAHLGCGLVGEGEGQDMVWRDALVNEMEDLLRDDSCFAGAGAGEDELEAAGFYCGFLGGVEGHVVREVGAGEG